MSAIRTVDPPPRVWRVGRAADPLNFSRISAADAAIARAGNRFDVPGGGVCYLATIPQGCFAETLARFRVSPVVRAAVADEAEGYMAPGSVPRDWRAQRLLVGASIRDALPFVDVDDTSTQTVITRRLGADMLALGAGEPLDISIVRGPDRRLTRLIAAWAHDATDGLGQASYGGVRYVSRLGDYECWAVFDGSEIAERSRTPVLASHPALLEVAEAFDLRVF